MTRYRAYQANLAGRTIGEIFGRAAEFLKLAAAEAGVITDTGVQAGREGSSPIKGWNSMALLK
jgi:hypothetical protein